MKRKRRICLSFTGNIEAPAKSFLLFNAPSFGDFHDKEDHEDHDDERDQRHEKVFDSGHLGRNC
jgi:hypothetical protein